MRSPSDWQNQKHGSREGSWLANHAPETVTNDATEAFIRKIQEQRQLGFGFVPLIGAGFSAHSGAPLVSEIKTYLARCICLALGVAESNMRPWNPRTDQWPPFIDRDHKKENWELLVEQKLRSLIEEPQDTKSEREQQKWKAELPVFQEAIGAMAEWRTSLLFLSRVMRDTGGAYPNSDKPDVVALDAPLQEIIDSCFRGVLKDKTPTLGHKMLAMLAGALRLDLLLTTNFDDLLERAFAATRNSLEIFEVHLGDNLPHWSAVSEVRYLLKLHGNRHSLRADYSLDALPSETDKERFLEYFLSNEDRAKLHETDEKKNLGINNHLLVMGMSGTERRTRALIEHAWRSLSNQFRVFWLCYSNKDVENIRAFTRESRKRLRKGNDWTGSFILRYPDSGLFLLQLYQAIRKNLPPHASLFPSVSRLPYPPLLSNRKQSHLKRVKPVVGTVFRKKITEHIRDFERENGDYSLVVATSDSRVHGVMSACGELFREMEGKNICLWIDMNDISSADNLFEIILEAAYFRLGMEDWTPCYASTDRNRPTLDEICHLIRSVDRPWVIFLNARETPGANTQLKLYDDAVDTDNPHGWLDRSEDQITESDDPSACTNRFLELLEALCKHDPRASVVLLCRNAERETGLLHQLSEFPLLKFKVKLEKLESVAFEEDEVVQAAIKWAAPSAEQRRFLHSLVLMQRPRPPAVIWSSAVSLPTDQTLEDAPERLKWIKSLEDEKLIRRKPGGFIWMHSRCRNKVRNRLWDGSFRKFVAEDVGNEWNPKNDEPEIHARIAEWYEKVLDVSNSPAAVFEIVYHLCRSAECGLALGVSPHSIGWACDKVRASTALLKTHSFLIQTHGYSRGSCRRLEHTRDTLCDWIRQRLTRASRTPNQHLNPLRESLRHLQIVCTEIMRAIAREVGEDKKAYLRHWQIGALLAGGGSTDPRQWKNKDDRHLSEELHGATSFEWVEWLRWWRWCGMLGIASRSFRAAESSLEKALRYSTEANGGYPLPSAAIDWQKLARSDLEVRGQIPAKTNLQELRIEVLRNSEQYVALQLLKDKVDRRLRDILESDKLHLGVKVQGWSERFEQNRIEEIEGYIGSAHRLASAIRANDLSSDAHHTVVAAWCETRLLMHASGCATRQAQLHPENKERMVKTDMGLLGDAEATLRISDRHRYRSELALIELHRAEARLREAEAVDVDMGAGTKQRLSRIVRDLEQLRPQPPGRKQGGEIMNKLFGEGQERKEHVLAGMRRARSLVTDALRFLNRAEPVLRERRRNVWWTTWFFERRLRAVAYSVWLSIFESNTPIPFLGFEAAMWKASTVADSLLDITLRMIRVDAYRLATVVDAYTSCARALQIRLLLDDNIDRRRYHDREQQMRRLLQNALPRLEYVRQAREETDSLKPQSSMDDNVQEYVKAVQRRSKIIATEYLTCS